MLIIFACGVLLWAQKSVKVHPFLISINEITGQWDIVGHKHHDTKVFSTTHTLQESVVGEFVKYWFLVSNQEKTNELLWSSCERSQCASVSNTRSVADKCAIYCLSSDNVFNDFNDQMVPDYKRRISENEFLVIDPTTLKMQPLGAIADVGGTWQISVNVLSSSKRESMTILAYAVISRNMNLYPKTLGYYVSDFNAYRIK